MSVDIPAKFADSFKYVERVLSANIVEAKTIKNAKSMLNKVDDFEITILYINDLDKNLSDFYRFVSNCDCHLLVISNCAKESSISNYPDAMFVTEDLTQEKLVEAIREKIGIVDLDKSKGYIPIPSTNLLGVNSVFCDIYLNISNKKFIKILNEGDLYSVSIVKKYMDKGTENFYIKKCDFEKYSKYNSMLVRSKLTQIAKDRIIVEQIEGVKHVSEIVQRIGISEQVIEDVNIITDSCLRKMKDDNDDLFNLLNKAKNNGGYLYSHGLLISYVAVEIAKKMNWATQTTFQKIITASLLHDIALTDDQFYNITALDEAEINKLGWKKLKVLKNHPIKGAELVGKSKGLPPDVDKIILSHHEKPDGSGYPRGLNATSIFPMACIFIISEAFVNKVYNKEITPELKNEILEEFIEVYNKGNFRAPLEGFKKLIAA